MWRLRDLSSHSQEGRSAILATGDPWFLTLLIPISSAIGVASDERSQGVTLRTLSANVTDLPLGPYLRVDCSDQAFLEVFLPLCEDIAQRVDGQSESNTEEIVRTTLEDWRQLLASGSPAISREAAIGLIGEFQLLKAMAARPVQALEAWGGPLNEIHDFSLEGGSVEVKGSTAPNGTRVHISSIDQLTPLGDRPLHLLAVHLIGDRQGPSLDDHFNELVDMGYPRPQLAELCRGAGFIAGAAPDAHRFSVGSVRGWQVTPDFPGLRRGDIPLMRMEAVSRLNYDLDLDSQLGSASTVIDVLEAVGWQ